MSTNYYLDEPHNEAGHLGKWNGTYFTAHAPEGVDNFDQWAAQMNDHRIFAEHGLEATKDEVVEMATARIGNKAAAYAMGRQANAGNEFYSNGVLFTRSRFH
jgi:hypothetical protein